MKCRYCKNEIKWAYYYGPKTYKEQIDANDFTKRHNYINVCHKHYREMLDDTHPPKYISQVQFWYAIKIILDKKYLEKDTTYTK